MSKAITTSKVDYFRLPRPLWRKLKKHLPKSRKSTVRGGRPRASNRAVGSTQHEHNASPLGLVTRREIVRCLCTYGHLIQCMLRRDTL